MKRAAVIRQNNGMDKREALVVAHQIDVLIRKMYLASVSFYYTKQDGSIRHAVGTLTGYEHCFHRPYTPRPVSYTHLDVYKRQCRNHVYPACRHAHRRCPAGRIQFNGNAYLHHRIPRLRAAGRNLRPLPHQSP